MKKTFVSRAFFVITLLLVPYSALGSIRPYWAKRCISEPRYDRNCLTSFDVALMGGTTKKGRNGSKHKVNALDIYGYQDLSRAFQGVPLPTTLSTALRTVVDNMDDNDLTNKGANFGQLSYTGKFKYFGVEFSMTQNFCNGFFGQIIIPVHRVEVSNTAYTDKTAVGDKDGNWQAFLANYSALLAGYNYAAGDNKNTSVGDTMYLGGWTYNNDSVEYLDFLDVTIKAGVSVPTARQKKVTQAFSLPTGNNGHVGIPVSFDMALGMYEWFTWGMHVGGQFFLKHDGAFRMKTNSAQNGFIKFGLGAAREDLGNIWEVGSYLKADHIAGGFSLAVGYQYTAQEATTLTPYETDQFTSSVVNDDETLKKWRRHAISVMVDYDFAQEGKSWNPKVGLFYNQPVAGKRIFNTKTFGGNAGLNITWNF